MGRLARRWQRRLTAAALLAATATPAAAQSSGEGAIFLLRPVGARSVGVGQSSSARRDGVEAAWINPAAVAGLRNREVALFYSQDFFATANAVAIAFPSVLGGTIVAAGEVQDFGAQEVTGEPGSPPQGTLLPRALIVTGSYASRLTRVLRVGVALKLVQLRLDCTGACNIGREVAQTHALDGGAQWDLLANGGATLAVSVRHVGRSLRAGQDERDRLPTRFQVGVAMRYPIPERYRDILFGTLSADLVQATHNDARQLRLGADLSWEGRAFIRAGYVFATTVDETGGPSLGLGILSGNLQVDIARVFTGFSTDAGQAPTYLSILLRL